MEYTPDVIGAFARSGASNCWPFFYSYFFQGNAAATAETILPSTLKSTGIYTLGLVSVFAGYRVIEYVSHPLYRKEATMTQTHLQRILFCHSKSC